MPLFETWIAGRATFREFASLEHGERYVAAAKRNHRGTYEVGDPRGLFKCEAVDPEAECTGLTGDPRCTGRYCTCNV